jgi:hypothetical protein
LQKVMHAYYIIVYIYFSPTGNLFPPRLTAEPFSTSVRSVENTIKIVARKPHLSGCCAPSRCSSPWAPACEPHLTTAATSPKQRTTTVRAAPVLTRKQPTRRRGGGQRAPALCACTDHSCAPCARPAPARGWAWSARHGAPWPSAFSKPRMPRVACRPHDLALPDLPDGVWGLRAQLTRPRRPRRGRASTTRTGARTRRRTTTSRPLSRRPASASTAGATTPKRPTTTQMRLTTMARACMRAWGARTRVRRTTTRRSR